MENAVRRPLGITIVALLMILLGIAEVSTGLTHNFLSLIAIVPTTLATYGAMVIGALYALGDCCSSL